MKRACPDLEHLVSFLSNQVSKSDEYYRKRLKRGLVWVNNTIEDKHIIGERNLYRFFAWIDVSYDVNDNMRSHPGGAI